MADKTRTVTIRHRNGKKAVITDCDPQAAAELQSAARRRGATTTVTECTARGARAIAEGGIR